MYDVIGKLQYTSDLQWSLNAVVTDNHQDQLSVKFSDEVCKVIIILYYLKPWPGNSFSTLVLYFGDCHFLRYIGASVGQYGVFQKRYGIDKNT